MRFLALMRKELRECLPWLLLAAIFFLVFGGLALQIQTISQSIENRYRVFSPFSEVNYYELRRSSSLDNVGALLFLTSIGLGLVLGGRQFWVPHFTKTWGFTLHRSVGRQAILFSKLAAAAAAFVISVGTVWIIFYWYAWRPGLFAVPPTIRVFIEGWIFIASGLVIYLGTALAGLSSAKWYTAKIFGLAFAVLILATTLIQWRLTLAFTAAIVGVLILLSQIIDTFLNREF